MKLTLVERQPVQVVCRRYTGPFGEPVGRFWRLTVFPWLAEFGLLDCPRYGVALDNPMHTAPENCRYDACIELPAGLELEVDLARTTVAGGRYAVLPFKGTSAEITAVWDRLIGAVFQGGWQPDFQRHPFEHYPRGALADARTGTFACELHVPLDSQEIP